MDAEALLHPRGPLPPGVYWRRRSITIAVVLASVFVLLRACGGDDGDTLRAGNPTSPTRSPSATPSAPAAASARAIPAASPSSSPSPSPQRVDGEPCRDTDLAVTVTAGGTTFGPGQRPRLTLVVTNRAPVACTRDLGGTAREIRVVSGADRVWSSDDCSPGGAADVVLLQPAASRSFPVTWSRSRSRPGCPTDRPAAGPGTYRAIGRIGSIERPGATFTLR